ncbi:DUF2938 domain-containing protein [Mesorhizobium sp. B2-6-2]|uniref:DUF2938 domain-containing protein n=1 Tax=Mesorhizobium sp. B2-6-2 TaxID=2589915 RepID=UPI001FEDAF24|nr:DUF2938 domain-containing protein [Mesorhizobium sp. B2-6-2]
MTYEIIVRAALVRIGATLLMDLWGALLKRGFGVPTLNYAMVGRWLGHMCSGRFIHASITAAPPLAGEQVIGWVAHYAIGIMFAAVVIAVFGVEWARQPSLGPALAVGVATVIAPFFLMQPGMGLGVAASRTPSPNAARLRSLATHAVFGIGLYGSAWALARMFPS